jgi:hypothetical protein
MSNQTHPQRGEVEGGGCRAAARPQTEIQKNTGFVDTMTSDVLRDLLCSRNQPWLTTGILEFLKIK